MHPSARTGPEEGKLPIATPIHVVVCRQYVRKLAESLQFSDTDATKLVTAASELARNALTYGGGGEMYWWIVREDNRRGVKLSFVDQGPGIADVDMAMTDGWSSGRGLGLGLPGARRLVNEFEIESSVAKGTRITITRWALRR